MQQSLPPSTPYNDLQKLITYVESALVSLVQDQSSYNASVNAILKVASAVKKDEFKGLPGATSFEKELAFYKFLGQNFLPLIVPSDEPGFAGVQEIFGTDAASASSSSDFSTLKTRLQDSTDSLFEFANLLDGLNLFSLLDDLVRDQKPLTNANFKDALVTELAKKIKSFELLKDLRKAVTEVPLVGPLGLMTAPTSKDRQDQVRNAVRKILQIVVDLDINEFSPCVENSENIRTLFKILKDSFLDKILCCSEFGGKNIEKYLQDFIKVSDFSLLQDENGTISPTNIELWNDFIKKICAITQKPYQEESDYRNLVPCIKDYIEYIKEISEQIDSRKEIAMLPSNAAMTALGRSGGVAVFQGCWIIDNNNGSGKQTVAIANFPHSTTGAIQKNYQSQLEAMLREVFANENIWKPNGIAPNEQETRSLLRSIIKIIPDKDPLLVTVAVDFDDAINNPRFANFAAGLKKIDNCFRNNELLLAGRGKVDLLDKFYTKINQGRSLEAPALKKREDIQVPDIVADTALRKIQDRAKTHWSPTTESEYALCEIATRLINEARLTNNILRPDIEFIWPQGTKLELARTFLDKNEAVQKDFSNMTIECLLLRLASNGKQQLEEILEEFGATCFDNNSEHEHNRILNVMNYCIVGEDRRYSSLTTIIEDADTIAHGSMNRIGYDGDIVNAVTLAKKDGEPIGSYLFKLARTLFADVHINSCLHDFLRGDKSLLSSEEKNNFALIIFKSLCTRAMKIYEELPAGDAAEKKKHDDIILEIKQQLNDIAKDCSSASRSAKFGIFNSPTASLTAATSFSDVVSKIVVVH